MGWIVLFLIIAVPLVEITIFIKVAGLIGIGGAILLAIGAGVLGLILLRHEGFATLMRARAAIDAGKPPVKEVFDGLCLLAAGGFLLLPGLASDVIALALLLPPVRNGLRMALARRLDTNLQTGAAGPRRTADGHAVIEAEFEIIEDHGPTRNDGPQGDVGKDDKDRP